MGKHGDEIVARRARIHALVPQADEVFGAFEEFGAALFLGFDETARHRCSGRHVGPARQLAAFREGEVEQRREHLRRQFDRDAVHPVEGFVLGKAVENIADALADRAFELGEVRRRDDGAYRLALIVMLGRVHGDEHRKLEVLVLVAQHDAAFGREDLVVGVHRHDVLVARDRPVRSGFLVGRAVMHGRLGAQALEVGPHRVVLEEKRIGDVDLLQRSRIGGIARFVGLVFHGSVAHLFPPPALSGLRVIPLRQA